MTVVYAAAIVLYHVTNSSDDWPLLALLASN